MKKNGLIKEIKTKKPLYLMMIPGLLLILVFAYIPMLGITTAFKDGNTVRGYFSGDWVGFGNFEFFFKSQDAARITGNTLTMNALFILSITCGSIIFAVLLSELKKENARQIKLYQSVMMVPYFLSWVVMGFITFAFLSVDSGFINKVLIALGFSPVNWYSDPGYWPPILVIVNFIKNIGYNTVVYYAGIVGIDETYYEAAKIDGANRFKQMIYITLPSIAPLISVMVLLSIGKIFYADFGLFYYIPRETGVLFPKTDVIDTYVFRALKTMGNIGMSAAIGLFQSVVGFVLVLGSNLLAKKINPDNALF